MKGFDGKDSKNSRHGSGRACLSSNVKQLRSGQSDPSENAKAELLRLRDQIAALVEKNPQKAATILADWIAETAKSNPKKKAG